MMRRRRPLMRAAMVGGAAYAVGKHAQRGDYREEEQEARLQQVEAQQYAAQAPPMPPAGGPTDIAANLAQLKSLLDQGALTQAEFDAAKQKLLSG
jgi:membrane protease subunit (stomatin/prohibitin family)